jgi:hypothetical protein
VKDMVDRVAEGVVRSVKAPGGFSLNITTVLPGSGHVGLPTDTFLRSAGRPFYPEVCQDGQDGKTAA